MLSNLVIAQVVVAVLLIISILLQSSGSGLGGVFGGAGAVYSTKRGIEKGLFFATIILSVLFFGLAVANLVIA